MKYLLMVIIAFPSLFILKCSKVVWAFFSVFENMGYLYPIAPRWF